MIAFPKSSNAPAVHLRIAGKEVGDVWRARKNSFYWNLCHHFNINLFRSSLEI